MSDPQNLGNSSPGALSTGAPPSLSPPLAPAPPTPSTAQNSPPPPTTGGATSSPPVTTTANSGPAPGVLGQAGSGAPAQLIGLGLGDCCILGLPGSGSGGGPAIPSIIVASIAALFAIVAGTVPVTCVAYVGTPPAASIWVTQNAGADWQQYA